MKQHGDQDETDRAWCRGRSGATAILLLRAARPEVHPAVRTQAAAGVAGRAGVPGRMNAASLTCRHRRAPSSVIDGRRQLESSHWANLLSEEHLRSVEITSVELTVPSISGSPAIADSGQSAPSSTG